MHTNPTFLNRLVSSLCLVSVVIVLGCHAKHTLTKEDIFEANFALFVSSKDSHQEVQQNIVEQIPLRLGSLKSGMTPDQVFGALNLPKHLGCFSGAGDPKYYRLGFRLQTNRFMVIKFNMEQQPPSFIEAQLTGDGWGD